jgi:signal peptidase I
MAEKLSLEEIIPTIKESLASGSSVSFTVTGNSMLPMLHHGVDSVTLSPIGGRLKKYDLPFYRRGDGKYILHRVVRVLDDEYVIRGDNCDFIERGIKHGDVIGIVTAFTRKGKTHSTNEFSYKVYKHLWCNGFSYFVRKKILLKGRVCLARAYRKIFKKK